MQKRGFSNFIYLTFNTVHKWKCQKSNTSSFKDLGIRKFRFVIIVSFPLSEINFIPYRQVDIQCILKLLKSNEVLDNICIYWLHCVQPFWRGLHNKGLGNINTVSKLLETLFVGHNNTTQTIHSF